MPFDHGTQAVTGGIASDGKPYAFGVGLPTAAGGTLTSDNTNVANGDTVTISGYVYVFRTTLTGVTTEFQVLIGADADGSLTNLASEANNGRNKQPYGTFSAVASHAIVFTASGVYEGSKGNGLATTETSAHLSWGATTLSGGGFGGQSGAAFLVQPTLVVDTNIYASGDDIGGKQTLTGALRATGGYFTGVTITDAANQKSALLIVIFSSNPTAATITDQAPFVPSTDITKIVAALAIATTDYVTVGSVAFADVSCLSGIKSVGGSTLYAAVISQGTPTYTTAADLQIIYKFDQN